MPSFHGRQRMIAQVSIRRSDRFTDTSEHTVSEKNNSQIFNTTRNFCLETYGKSINQVIHWSRFKFMAHIQLIDFMTMHILLTDKRQEASINIRLYSQLLPCAYINFTCIYSSNIDISLMKYWRLKLSKYRSLFEQNPCQALRKYLNITMR